jgi:hypothetical protein
MGRIFNIKRKLSGEEFMSIETILEAVMHPVAPRQEFVLSLKERVLTNAFPEAEKIENQAKKDITVLVLSLMGVTIILGVWIRVVISLLKLFGSNNNQNRRPRRRRIAPAHSAA